MNPAERETVESNLSETLSLASDARLHRFTVEEYYRLAEHGILSPEQRVELIEGEVVDMTPAGSRHAMCVVRLTELFYLRLAGRMHAAIQNPIRLGAHSEPQPDVAVLRFADYSEAHPGPEDVLLVIEVADTSLLYDRRIKAALYGQAGIREYWLVNLEAESIELFRRPTKTGYGRKTIVRRGQSLSPLAFRDFRVEASEILGKPRS
jgi:Uma2 family endonuclease